jgi:predicted lipoprotein with Yx(FWY)xxD motif
MKRLDLKKMTFVVIVLVLVFALAACGTPSALPKAQENEAGAESETPAAESAAEAPVAPTAGAAAPAATPAEAMINVVNNATLGNILVGNKGMTLYMFTTDAPDKSNCAGQCLVAWPPLLTQGSPVLGAGVDAAMVGKTQLPDGTWIVTYNHWPLYYFIKDKAAGDVFGQKVAGTWFVIGPDGKPIGMP